MSHTLLHWATCSFTAMNKATVVLVDPTHYPAALNTQLIIVHKKHIIYYFLSKGFLKLQ